MTNLRQRAGRCEHPAATRTRRVFAPPENRPMELRLEAAEGFLSSPPTKDTREQRRGKKKQLTKAHLVVSRGGSRRNASNKFPQRTVLGRPKAVKAQAPVRLRLAQL